MNGVCTDEDMLDKLGHLFRIRVCNMDKKPMNQQRSLWLNRGPVLQMRKDREEAKKLKEAETKRKRVTIHDEL